MTGMAASVSMPLGGVQVGSYDSYEQAQAAVDYLSDEKFPVENVTIIGTDLRQIEKVTGRLTTGRAIAAGAAGGAWWGLFVGLLLGIFSTDGGAWIGSVLTGLVIGLVVRRRCSAGWATPPRVGAATSPAPARSWPSRYDVMCNPAHAEEARAHAGPLLPPRLTAARSGHAGQRRVAKAIAAAAATPSESTPGAHRDPRPHPRRLPAPRA